MTSVAMFALGYAIGFGFAIPLFHFFVPERMLHIMLFGIVNVFAMRHECGLAMGTLFATAPFAAVISGQRSSWLLQVFTFLAIGTIAALFVALLHGASFRRMSPQDFQKGRTSHAPVQQHALPPYYGALAIVFLALAIRARGTNKDTEAECDDSVRR